MKLPKDHGFVSLWGITLIFGIVVGSIRSFSLAGTLLAILFSVSILLAYQPLSQI